MRTTSAACPVASMTNFAQGQKMYQERKSIIDGRLKELLGAIKNAEDDISRTQNMIMGIPSSKDISQAELSLRMIILQNTLPKYENNLTDLRNQLPKHHRLLSLAHQAKPHLHTSVFVC